MKRSLGCLLCAAGLAAASAAGCAGAGERGEPLGKEEQEAQPIDRLLMGKAAKYPADRSLDARLPALSANMAERRRAAWAVVEKVLAPVPIAARMASLPLPDQRDSAAEPRSAARLTLPRFQTWYSREDILPMFDRLFRDLPDAKKRNRARFSKSAVDAVFPWNATMAPTLASFTEERRAARLAELQTRAGLRSLGKDARTLMSPAFVGHLLRSYPEMVACGNPSPDQLPVSGTNFAPCLDGEFPTEAAAVKLRWMPALAPIPTYDTSRESLGRKLSAGSFGEGDGQATPDEQSIYTMQLTPDTSMRLAAIHIMTKELRDWAWVSLWWSSDPDSDFGKDRPASIKALGGPWGNYKMCVVVAFDEADVSARTSPDDPSSWCSNPYLEQAEGAAKTSCIGCHQHGGTPESTESILAAPLLFPRNGRQKVRSNFPSDYTFTTSGGLELASSFRAKIDALAP